MRPLELTPGQIQSLCNAIEASVPNRDDLERIVYFCLEKDLFSIVEQGNYPTVIFKLVRWSKGQDNLCKLVEKVCYENPGNPELQRFLSDYWLSFLNFSKSQLLDEQQNTLIECLRKIEDFEEIVIPAFKKTLPGVPDHHKELLTRLVDSRWSPILKWGWILDIFLEEYAGKQSDGCLYIVNFVRNLSERATDENFSLQEWLSGLPPNLQPSSRKKLSGDMQFQELKAEFLITVEYPDATSETENASFSVKGYLVTFFGDRHRKPKIQKIPLSIEDTGAEGKQESERIDDVTNRSAKIKDIQDIKEKLPDWVKEVESLAREECLNAKTDYDLENEPIYDLTVEFWLPFEHLLAKVESWEIYKLASRRNRHTAPAKTCLSRRHGVLVRSYDRFEDIAALNVLRRSWDHLSSLSQDNTSDSVSTCGRVHLETWEHWASIRQQLSTHFYWGVMFSCPLCLGEGLQKWENLFDTMLERGIPIALWSRNTGLVNLKMELDALWTLSEPYEVLGKVREKRQQADEAQHLGHHLAIWCDEPQPFIELKEFLREGRLRA